MQNRRKQEKLQNQRRYVDVYSLSGKNETGRKMLEFGGDNDLARTHNLRKLGGNSDTDTSQGIEQKHPTNALKYIDDNNGGHHRNKHPVTYLESGDPPPRYCQDEQMVNHKLAKHAEHGNEISKTDPKRSLAKHHDLHTEVEHKIEQTTIHTVITKKEKNHVSQSHSENRQMKGSIEDNHGRKMLSPSEQKPSIVDQRGSRGARDLRSLLNQDNSTGKSDILRKQNNAVKDKQKKNCQIKTDAKKSKVQKALKSAPKVKK